MKLSQLLERLPHRILFGDTEAEISEVVYDSRKVKPGTLFVCIPGTVVDGHKFMEAACEAGAEALVIQSDHEVPEALAGKEDLTVIETENCRYALAILSAAYFGFPADTLPVVGVTGTKGKTTTTYMIKSILENAGKKVGLIGTIEVDTGSRRIPANNTTPESFLVQSYLREMADNGCDLAVMEVSSQALMMDRTAGILFEIGVFTNIEPDHIGPNEHKDFEEYLACKSLLFRQCRHGIFNADDEHISRILEGHTCTVETVSAKKEADYYADGICHVYEPGYLGVRYDLHGKMNFPVELDIPGLFTVYNSLTAIAVAAHFGVSDKEILPAMKKARVKGRVEIVEVSDRYTLMIDYAHNAMALRSLLETLRDYEPKRLVCVFGCGGNRARDRRFEMGEVSGHLADLTVITSDNPRFEEPQAIIEDIKTGIGRTDGKYIEIADRKEAIRYAMRHAETGDVIVLAGKGHEDYQEIRGVHYPMDERVLIKEIIEEDGDSIR